MKYIKELEEQGYQIEFEKENTDSLGYDLFLRVRKDGSFYESFFSMSNSKGYYFSIEKGNDCLGGGCDWEFDDDKLVCEYLGIKELNEM